MKKQRVLLTEEDFKTLTNGGVVKKGNIEVALQDIGFFRMLQILKENMYERGTGEKEK